MNFNVVFLKNTRINSILIMTMLIKSQYFIIRNVKINRLVHFSFHIIGRNQFIIKKTPPTHHRPNFGLNVTLHTFSMKCFIWPSVHTTTCVNLNKGKNVIWHSTLHSASQLLSTFRDLWTIEDAQIYVPVCAMTSSEVHDSKCSLHASECSLANMLGWTFIKRLHQFLSGLETTSIHKTWNSSLVHFSQDPQFSTTSLTSCFLPTCISPLCL